MEAITAIDVANAVVADHRYKHFASSIFPSMHDIAESVVRTYIPNGDDDSVLDWEDRAIHDYEYSGHEEIPGRDVPKQRRMAAVAICKYRELLTA